MHFYRITLNNHIKNSWTVLIYLVLSIAYVFYMISSYGFEDFSFFLISGVTFFCVFFIPVVVIHFNYYFTNKHDLFIYDELNQRISFTHRGETYDFFFKDIEHVKRFKSYPLAENRLQWTPWDNYNYSIIYLKNKKRLLVTSLLVPNLDLPISKARKSLVKSFYCYASINDKDELNTDDNSTKIPDIFKKNIIKKSNQELEEIIKAKDQYDTLFVLCANRELEKRKQQ